MGCRAITPKMASLAKRLVGKPFHLIFSDNQNKGKAAMMAYLQGQGFDPAWGNWTLSKFAGHSSVKGNGHVPYYFLLDHTGKLRYDHMCGKYHGGDGMACTGYVDTLLKSAPLIYAGSEPFTHHSDLAKKVQNKVGLAKVTKQIEEMMESRKYDGDSRGELARLYNALTDYRDREMTRISHLLAHEPHKALPAYKTLSGELAGHLDDPIDKRIEELESSKAHKQAIKIGKALEKYLAWYTKSKIASKSPSYRASVANKLRKTLGKLTKGYESLAVSQTVETWLKSIE